MGQKTSPIGLRLGIRRKHQSHWCIDPRSGSMKRLYPALILEDRFIRNRIKYYLPFIEICQILIYRILNSIKVEIYTTKKGYHQFFTFHPNILKQFELSSRELDKAVNNRLKLIKSRNQVDEQRSQFFDDVTQNGTKELKKQLQIKNAMPVHKLFRCVTKRGVVSYKYLPCVDKNDDKARTPFYSILYQELKEYKEKLWFLYPGSKKRIISDQIKNEGKHNDQFDYFPTRRYRRVATNLQARFNMALIVLKAAVEEERYQYAAFLTKFLVTAFERRKPVKRIINNFTKFKLFDNMEYKLGIHGIKVKISGRIDGVDMAEQIIYRRGRIPLSTVSAKIDYCYDIAKTMYGILGIKVWVYIND